MQCPKCHAEMETRNYGRKISIERCTGCMGLFAKPDTLVAMKQEWMSEVLDRGDPSVGREYNQVDDIDCPECGTRMDKVADEKQTHIWYESCPSCEGIFFDAGEFTDWKYDTFMDRIRMLIRGKRS